MYIQKKIRIIVKMNRLQRKGRNGLLAGGMAILGVLMLGVFPSFASWQQVDEGFEFQTLRVESPPYDSVLQLRVLRVDPGKFQVRIIDSRAFGSDRLAIKTLAQKAGAIAAINGGFFTPGWEPLGLLITDGIEINPLRRTDWGIFMIQNGQPRIIHTNQFQYEKDISQALQVGPRLVVEGREVRLKKQAARRSAIGITYTGQVVLLNTGHTEAYAHDLARIFRLPESEGGLECRDALSLDGGPSAQMYVDYKFLKLQIPGGWGIPNGIGIFLR
jgi:uncharacterized protein YigE (DUF2233 family)